MNIDISQRWAKKRVRWVPDKPCLDPERFEVDVIDDARAIAWVKQEHYSGSCGASRLCVGMHERLGGGEKRLVGVAVFGFLMQAAAAQRWCSQPVDLVPDLNRLVLLDTPFNSESFFVARALAILKERLPRAKALLSYTDPVPRSTIDGTNVLIGHCGTVYQALSMRFVGRSSPRTLWLDRDGRALSGRALTKIRKQESGSRYAERQLVLAGASPRAFAESGQAYVERVLAEGMFRPLKHPGNLVYVLPLDRSHDVVDGLAPALPYLKRGDLGLDARS